MVVSTVFFALAVKPHMPPAGVAVELNFRASVHCRD